MKTTTSFAYASLRDQVVTIMDWMRFRPIYFLISAAALAFSAYSIFAWGFKPSIDFTGGSIAEYRFTQPVDAEVIKSEYKPNQLRKISQQDIEFRFGPEFTQAAAQELSTSLEKTTGQKPELVRFEIVGPVLSVELLRKTYIAIAIAAAVILLWITWQFRSLQLGVSAILATLHDSVVLLGTFAALGHYKGVEVDILFVTALLTVLSFSVHDTIVVYDRIRESTKKLGRLPIVVLANKAVSDTMVRSLNNSLTIVFMLVALFLIGGATIKWFVFALFIGTISGTYSSPFVAVPLLVTWDHLRARWKRWS